MKKYPKAYIKIKLFHKKVIHIKNIIPKKTNKNKAKVPKNNLERSLAQKII